MTRKLSTTIAQLCVVGALCFVQSQASAIPMWEYLSRGEKMSHLFNMFVQQVEKHCSEQQQSEPDCSKLLLVYGLSNLANMADQSLDDMDPYQRDANKIVWDSMMAGSHTHNTTPKGQSIDEADDMAAGDDEQGAASAVHETQSQPQTFLLGPMVVRVLPNGMPIPGEKNDLPKDEDVEEIAPNSYKMAKLAKQISSSTPSTIITTTIKTTPPTTKTFNNYQPQGPYRNLQQQQQQQYPQPRTNQPFGQHFSIGTRVRSPMYTVY